MATLGLFSKASRARPVTGSVLQHISLQPVILRSLRTRSSQTIPVTLSRPNNIQADENYDHYSGTVFERYQALINRALKQKERQDGPKKQQATDTLLQFTIRSNSPDDFTQEDLISDLKELTFEQTLLPVPGNSEPPVLVILVTPKFVTWFEQGEEKPKLIPTILEIIRPFYLESCPNLSEVNVICACVDGLSPQPSAIPHTRGNRQPVQGFTFLTGFTPAKLWAENQVEYKVAKPSLTFEIREKGHRRRKHDTIAQRLYVTLPLANTLFKTGSPSMLSISKWIPSTNGDYFRRVNLDRERENVVIQLSPSSFGKGSPQFSIPAFPLTPARKIASGLGNIVRTVEFNRSDNKPASHELETAVTDFLKSEHIENSLVEVWALIVSKDAIANPLSRLKLMTAVKQWEEFDPEYLGYWIGRKAKFCRVLSGGGGWGEKEGLLSLDTEVIHIVPDEAGDDVFELQESMLSGVVRKGDFVQFFVRKHDEGKRSLSIERSPSEESNTQVFGSIPSTIDDIETSEPAAQGTTISAKSELIQGHFGCVSESGMFCHFLPPTSTCTKIDMPYSYIIRDTPHSTESVTLKSHL